MRLQRKRNSNKMSWECELAQPLRERICRLLKKLKIAPAYDPDIPLSRTWAKEVKSTYESGKYF